MAKEKNPGGRPKGSKNKRRTPARPGGKGTPPSKTQPCKNLSKPGHGTDWHCDACNDTGEVTS
jgi:hypothetical protein